MVTRWNRRRSGAPSGSRAAGSTNHAPEASSGSGETETSRRLTEEPEPVVCRQDVWLEVSGVKGKVRKVRQVRQVSSEVHDDDRRYLLAEVLMLTASRLLIVWTCRFFCFDPFTVSKRFLVTLHIWKRNFPAALTAEVTSHSFIHRCKTLIFRLRVAQNT